MLPLLALVAHPLLAEIAAGCAGGMAKVALFHPLDYMTTWRELPSSTKRPPRRNPYAGVGLTLAGAAPYAAVFHSAFWLCARSLNGLPAGSRELLAGSGGAVAATAVGVPFECLKHRVQLQVPGYDTPLRALRSTLRDRELYAGTASTLCRNLPYNALHFGIFAAAQRALSAAGLAPAAAAALAGALAGALTALFTTPLDLVNTRLQTQGALAQGPRYSNPLDAAATIARDEGPLSLFRGAFFRVALYAPSAVVFFFVYDAVKRSLGVPI